MEMLTWHSNVMPNLSLKLDDKLWNDQNFTNKIVIDQICEK